MNFSDDLQTLTSLIYVVHASGVATVTSTKQTTMKQGAHYFLVKVFHQTGSCYKHIPESLKKNQMLRQCCTTLQLYSKKPRPLLSTYFPAHHSQTATHSTLQLFRHSRQMNYQITSYVSRTARYPSGHVNRAPPNFTLRCDCTVAGRDAVTIYSHVL